MQLSTARNLKNIIGIQYYNVCDSCSSCSRFTLTGLPALNLGTNSGSNCINERNSSFAGISSRCTPLHALAKTVRSRVAADGADGRRGENYLRRLSDRLRTDLQTAEKYHGHSSSDTWTAVEYNRRRSYTAVDCVRRTEFGLPRPYANNIVNAISVLVNLS